MRSEALLFCVILLCAGCSPSLGNDDLKDGDVLEKPTPKLHIIEIKQMKFLPDYLVVNKGDTVRFINNDLVVHDVTEESQKAWTSSPLLAGKSWDLVVTQSVTYFCSLHVVMEGEILVKK